MRQWLTILLIIAGFAVNAQTMSGIIADGQTGIPLYGVTIVNTATQVSAYSNDNGEFTIPAKTGETVVFTFIGFKDSRRTMPPSTGVAKVRIEMEPSSIQLGEVVIRPDYTPYQLDSVRRRSTYQRALVRQKSNLMSPVSMLAEKVNGRSKQLYSFQKNFNKWENQRYIDSRYTPELVTQLTGLKGDSVGVFMTAHPMPYDYARAATDMELMMWVRYNYRQWAGKPGAELTKPEEHLTNR